MKARYSRIRFYRVETMYDYLIIYVSTPMFYSSRFVGKLFPNMFSTLKISRIFWQNTPKKN